MSTDGFIIVYEQGSKRCEKSKSIDERYHTSSLSIVHKHIIIYCMLGHISPAKISPRHLLLSATSSQSDG